MARFKLTQSANRERAQGIFALLGGAYPGARCSLDYAAPLELLVATILAAQCTDERVNIVTKDLFAKYRTPEDYAGAPQEELAQDIRTCGFFNQKAKSIQQACRMILEDYGGEVPRTLAELTRLPGVGRKTANVILGECFGVPGVVVDTHCTRVSQRLAFTKETDPAKIERDLMMIWPEPQWTQYSHLLVFHGRSTCVARAPQCTACAVRALCPFPETREGKKIAK